MSKMRRWVRRTRTVVGSWSRRTRLALALSAVLAAAGLAWLACTPKAETMSPVVSEAMDEGDLAAAAGVLQSQGLTCRVSGGKLLVRNEDVPRARGLLVYEGILPQNIVASFEQLAREDNIWSSAGQSEKRWQAAKMAALGKLIGMFPPVRSAVVIYEVGSQRKLGSGAVEPTASVKVSLKSGSTMDSKLLGAIADLVSGSISGMSRDNVRIIDNAGRSYRMTDAGPASADDRIEQTRVIEAFFCQKIHTALPYIENLIAGVSISGDDGSRCSGASVSIPRSYLLTAAKGSYDLSLPPTDEQLAAMTQGQLERIRSVVAGVTGMSDPAMVRVDWYYDQPSGARQAAGSAPAIGPLRDNTALFGLLGVAVIVSGGALVLRRVRRGGKADGSQDDDSEDSDEIGGAMAFLQQVGDADLLALLRQEHPQTIALVLAHLAPVRAAAMLAGLTADVQVEVAGRIAGMEQVDAEVVREVERSMVQRLGESSGPKLSLGGTGALAKILHHASPDTEQAVLDGLGASEPSLAETIRQRMFTFEDIAQTSPARLRSALENVGGEELALALRTAGDEIKQRIFASLSPQAARNVTDEMERIGPVRLSDVEAAQRHVAQAVRQGGQGQYVRVGGKRSEVLA